MEMTLEDVLDLQALEVRADEVDLEAFSSSSCGLSSCVFGGGILP